MTFNITELVKQQVHLDFYRDGELHYRTDSGFRFVVPISDCGSGLFKPVDRGILFMRWIRRAVEELTKAQG